MPKNQPSFKTEAQEAEWFAKNQNLIADRFVQAKTAGKLGKGTVARVAGERAGASPTTTIRLAEEDLTRARSLAAEKGLRVSDVSQNATASGVELGGEKDEAAVTRASLVRRFSDR